PFTAMIESLTDNSMVQLSAVHIIFNVVSTFIMFPFAKYLVKLSCILVPEKKSKNDDGLNMVNVDDRMINTPPVAVAQVGKEVIRMATLARNNFDIAAQDLINKNTSHFEEIQKTEEIINYLNHNITPFLVKINALDLGYQDAQYIGRMFHVINDIERIGDHAVNLSEAAKNRVDENIELSPESENELRLMYKDALSLIDGSIEAFALQKLDATIAENLNALEASVDDMKINYEEAHIERLNKHQCSTRAGMLFVNTITDFERVADHAINIAWSVKTKPALQTAENDVL
ncbi:MAG: PhoU domain-containing protein, partial [Oscillospiraceae bacterium]